MRTIFEDTNLQAELEEDGKDTGNKYLLLILWSVAIVFLVGTWSIYRWANNSPAPTPPPPPVSLQDLKQVSAAFSQFNGFVRQENWTEAEAMLSTYARQQLSAENKTLRESLLGKFKDLKLTDIEATPSLDNSDPNTFKQDFVFLFTDAGFTKSEQEIVTLSLIIENGKIVVNGWGEQQREENKEDAKPDLKKV
ncbi:MAG: hypothetical protein AB7P14_25520 [Blastocatellales bacterium]